jgi:hypothetical protein
LSTGPGSSDDYAPVSRIIANTCRDSVSLMQLSASLLLGDALGQVWSNAPVREAGDPAAEMVPAIAKRGRA